jgi:hypothetical protein
VALLAVVVEAVLGNRLLTPAEKYQLAQGLSQYGKRFGLYRVYGP